MNDPAPDIRATDPFTEGLSRRRFLISTAGLLGAMKFQSDLQARAEDMSQSADAMSRSRVVQFKSPSVVTPHGIHVGLLRDVLDSMLARMVRTSNATQAWRTLLDENDVIALVCEPSRVATAESDQALVAAMIESLIRSGFDRHQLVAVGVEPALRRRFEVQAPPAGWSEKPVDFGSGQDRTAAWLDQVTAIINVARVSTHNIGGYSGCLWNLFRTVIKHPARYFATDGSPHVGHVVAMPKLLDKLRLNVANGLRIPFQNGPDATVDEIGDAATLLAGRDPVAVDTIGAVLLDDIRRALRLPGLGESGVGLNYIRQASADGAGRSRLQEIDWIKVEF